MANYNKQFNFRNGVQVDNDNLVVSPTGLVGIGTTIPTEALDVRGGNAKVSGFATATSLYSKFLEVDGSAGVTTITFTDAIGAGVSISGGIITATDPATGIVTYYGDARYLQGMPTSQWVDIDAGLGYTSIYAQGNVGVGTTDPRFTFQVGGVADNSLAGFETGVGISSDGNVLISGITTANKFVGIGSDLTLLDADNISSGTLTNDRIPVLESSKIPDNIDSAGIITATSFDGTDLTITSIGATNISATGIITASSFVGDITGNVTGIASTALSLSGTPNIIVGVLTASSFIGDITGDVTGNVTGNVTGTATTATALTTDAVVNIDQIKVGLATVDASIGIGTDFYTGFIEIGGTNTGTADLFINRTVGVTTTDQIPATIKLLSDRGRSAITIGTSESDFGHNGQIRYANRDIGLNYSTPESFDFINYGNGNINSYLQAGTVGVDTGSFYWHDKNEVIMSLTYEGNLGIGKTDPTERLNVQGTAFFSGPVTFDDIITVNSAITSPVRGNLLDLSDEVIVDVSDKLLLGNVNTNSGISTFNEVSAGSTIKVDNIVVGGGLASRSSLSHIISGNSEQHRFYVNDSGAIGIATTFEFGDDIGITAPGKFAILGGIGVGTTVPRCAVDFADAGTVGIGTTQPYFLPTKISNTTRNGIGETVTGATIYNTDLNKLQVYTGSAWETLTSS